MSPSHTNWRLGLLLAVSTAALWSTLPIALEIALDGVDALTLTWVRLTVAALFTFVWVAARGQLSRFRGLSPASWAWLGLAAIGLVGNYVLYLVGLERTTPGNAQVLIQTAPLLLGLGGVVLFRERLSRVQIAGVLVLLTGLAVFFGDQLMALIQTMGTYAVGAGIILLAAVSWAAYALIQKKLAEQLGPQAILLVMYLFGAVSLAPTARPQVLLDLNAEQALAVGYACLNTLGAYGAFAAAVSVWQSARVSAVLTLTPLGTLILVQLVAWLGLGWVEAEQLGLWGYVGALAVVGGSMTVSLGAQRA